MMDHKLAIGVGAVLVAGVAVGLIVWLVALRGDSPPAQVEVPRDTPVPRDISVPVPTKAPIKYQTASSGINDLLEEVESGRSSVEDAASKAPLHYDSLVAVEIYVEGDVERLAETLEANGAALIGVDDGYVEAYVPLQYLGEAAALPGVVWMQPIVPPAEGRTPPPTPRATVTPPGPAVEHGASAWHSAGYTGKGIKVGIIDTGFEGFSGLMGTELPGTVHARCYRENPFLPHTTNISDCEYEDNHGTAVAEALFDMAPDVTLYVAQPNTNFRLRKTVDWMISEGVSVINHSVITQWDGPGDGTSPSKYSPLRTVDRAADGGILWVNGAGNEADVTWTGKYVDDDDDGWIEFAAADETNETVIWAGGEFEAQLRWDDPQGWNYFSVFKVSDLDLHLYDSSGTEVASSRDRQGSGLDSPYEFLHFQEPHGKNGKYSLRVAYRGSSGVSPPERVQLHILNPRDGWLEHATAEGSISTPADSSNPGMLAVGAAAWDAWGKGAVRDYSSRGPTSDGRIKPDIVGADGWRSVAYSGNFPGTSQAAPHVAGLAALVRQRYPDLSPPEVAQFLKDRAAVPEGVSVPNNEWGNGFAHLPADDLEVESTPEPTTPPTRGPQAAAFASISAGGHTCGLTTSGDALCWGDDGDGQATPPAGEFASVDAGESHTCGVKVNGTVACWGRDDYGQATPPAGEFASVSAGWEYTCGVRRDGTVACWGYAEQGQATPPAGEFASVSAGGWHTCGVRRDGTVACWGSEYYGQATPPAGEFASVSAGEHHTCGVKVNGSVACWGSNTDFYGNVVGQATPPAGEFASVSAGEYHTCGVRRDGTVACWGQETSGKATPPAGEFASVSAGEYHTCGVRRDGSVACWGQDRYGQATPPAGEFASVSTGYEHTCGVTTAGDALCWGDDGDGQATPPAGEFASVSAGYEHTCGVRRDGSVACWGQDRYGQATPPAGEFASVSAGGDHDFRSARGNHDGGHTCGVRTDGSIGCWGQDRSSQATPPAGEFASVSAGYSHTCGVRTDGSVACWGQDTSGKATPPAGEFASVSAGDSHTCGVQRDGTVACWGSDYHGKATPPAGEFASVDAGDSHTCGVKVNGSVACWGRDHDGQATPPAGEFASVSAGWEYTCGVRRDGSVACWGNQVRGLTAADFE